MAKASANVPGLTDRAPLTVESGVTALAAKGVIVVSGGRRQFRLALAATQPPSHGKICHWKSVLK